MSNNMLASQFCRRSTDDSRRPAHPLVQSEQRPKIQGGEWSSPRKHTVNGARLGGQAAAVGARHRVRLREECRTLHVCLRNSWDSKSEAQKCALSEHTDASNKTLSHVNDLLKQS